MPPAIPARPPLARAGILAAAVLAGMLAGCRAPDGTPPYHGLPRLERETPVPSAPVTTDFAWPLGHREERAGSDDFRIRPLWREVATDASKRTHLLYPLYRDETRGGDFTARLFPFYWRDRAATERGLDDDAAVVPFLWWGDEPGAGSYFLFLPFGGTAKGKFLVDDATFVLFPLYLRTRSGEYEGTHWLWPLAHFGEGGGRRTRRVYPFYAESRKEGSWEEYAAAWPIVQWGRSGLDTPHPSSHWSVWPLYGEETSAVAASRTVLWPFFQWSEGPRSRARDLPFPFFRTRDTFDADGKPESTLRWWWPVHGRFDGPGESSRFWAWPLWMEDETTRGGVRETGAYFNPFWASRSSGPADGAAPPARWWKLWPLAQGSVRPDGGSEWSALSPVPVVRWEDFDASWGVFFELARRRRDPDGATATDLLFSLVRHRKGPAGERHRVPLLWSVERSEGRSSWSLLEGLLGGETDRETGSSLRLLWFLRIPAR